jgi:hypothetical protein
VLLALLGLGLEIEESATVVAADELGVNTAGNVLTS